MKRTSLILILLLALVAITSGQTQLGDRFLGETLEYDGKLKVSPLLPDISIGDLKFTVVAGDDPGSVVVRSEAVSKGSLLRLFRFSFLQQYGSVMDRTSLNILKTTKHDVQKERIRDSEAVFDYTAGRVTFVEADPASPNRPPRRIASSIGPEMSDIVSGIYRIRTMPLMVGKTFEISLSDSGLVYSVPVRVAAREQQKYAGKKVWCLRIEPVVFGPGRLIEQKGSLTIWLTDDDVRLPIRGLLNLDYGKLDVRLKPQTPK